MRPTRFGARLWDGLCWLLCRPSPCDPQPTRMTAQAAAALAEATAKLEKLPFGFMEPQVREVGGRLIWRVDSATIGSGWRIEVDDATGVAGPVTRWGMR